MKRLFAIAAALLPLLVSAQMTSVRPVLECGNAVLRDMMVQYPDCGISGNKHLFTLLASAGFKI